MVDDQLCKPTRVILIEEAFALLLTVCNKKDGHFEKKQNLNCRILISSDLKFLFIQISINYTQ